MKLFGRSDKSKKTDDKTENMSSRFNIHSKGAGNTDLPEPEKNSAGASHEPEKELVSEPIDFGGTGNSDTVNDYLREAQRYSTLDAKSILEQRVQEENELEEKAQRINEEHFRKQQEKEEAERLAREEEERRLAAEKAERERQEAEERARKLEEERRAREEAERLEAERLERERIEREKREAEERERLERERIEREKREAEERERLEQERIEREKREAEERERLEQERIEREKREAEERERLEREKKERDRLEVQRLAKEEEKRLERERLEAEKRAKDEKLARAKELVEAQRIAEEERIARAEELRKSEERILAEERRKAEQKARIEAIAKAKEQARIDKLERAERAAKEREQARLDRLERMEEAARAKEQARREKIERAEREKKEREELRARKIAESAEQMKERERQRIEKEKRAAEIAKAKEAVKAKKREEMAARAEANEKENARYSKYERDIFGLGIIRRKLIKGRKYPILTIPSEEYATKSHDVYERDLNDSPAFSETAGGKATTIEPKMDTMSSFIMDNVFSDQTASIEQGESETWISEPILEGGRQIHPVRSTDENAGEDGKINARSVTEAVKLIKQRAASDFNLRKDAPDISYDREGRDNEPDGFFKDKKESYKLKKQMKMERRDLLYSTVAAIAAELVLIWLALGQRIQGVLPEAITASAHPISYVLVALVVFVVVMVASRFTLISGYNEICNRRPNIDSAVLVGSVATLIHTLFLFFNGRGVSDGTIPQYTAVAGLLLAMNTLGKYCFVSRTIKNFNFLCGTRDQYSFIHINDENGAIKMGDGIVTDEPVIGYPVKINGVSDFIRTARSESPSERLIRKMIVYFWGAALLVGFISMFTQMSFMQGFSAIILMLCVAVPASTLLIANIPLLRIAKKAKSKGCIICGYDSIRHNTDMNAVIIEASQIFDGSNVKIHGVKTFGGCPVDRAILFAAGMTYAADSPAKTAFERVIDGDLEILPQVQKLVYEDKLGLSGIIEGKRVLLGNKELMRKHGIMCPTRLYESKYRQNGRSLTFLSIDGVVSAMFVLSYTANETVRKKLTALSDMGIGILISSTDSNITSEYLTGIFELPADSLKVLSADGSRLYNEETRKNTNCTPVADTVFTGSVMSYIDSVIGVSRINLNVRLATLIQCAAILIGFIIAGVTALISGISGLTAIHVIIFEIVWAILINIVSNAGKYD